MKHKHRHDENARLFAPRVCAVVEDGSPRDVEAYNRYIRYCWSIGITPASRFDYLKTTRALREDFISSDHSREVL